MEILARTQKKVPKLYGRLRAKTRTKGDLPKKARKYSDT
jgi:hypothetical protein